MNDIFIIGNILGFAAAGIMVLSGFIRKKKIIILAQMTQCFIAAISNILLGGITGAINNIMTCIRNFIYYRWGLTKTMKVVLIIISAVLSLSFNTQGIVGILPLIACSIFIIFMDIQDIIKFKFMLIAVNFLWFTYDLSIDLYTAALFDAASIITNMISIVQIKRNQLKEEKMITES